MSSAGFWEGKTCLLRVVILNWLPLSGCACTQVISPHWYWKILFVSFHLLSCFMLSGKVAPSEWKSWTVFHGTPEKHKVAMGFVFVGEWAEWWLLLVCIWFHLMNSGFTSRILVSPRVVSPLSFYFFFFPLSNLQNFMPGKFPYSFRSPGAAELIRESQLLMVQVPVECCSHLGFAATGKQKKTRSDWQRVTC